MAEVVDKKIELRVVTMKVSSGGDNYKFQGPVDMAIMRCKTGDMGVLPGREDVSAVLNEPGLLRILNEGAEQKMLVYGGIAQLKNGVLTVLTEMAEWPEEVNQIAAEKDLKEAESSGNRDLARRARLQLDLGSYSG